MFKKVFICCALVLSANALFSMEKEFKKEQTPQKISTTCVAELKHENKSTIFCVAISPTGKLLATASSDKTAKIWDKNGVLIKTLGHEDKVTSVAFSPKENFILTTSQQKAFLWTIDGTFLRTFYDCKHAAFSPDSDNKIIIFDNDDNDVTCWEGIDDEWRAYEPKNSYHFLDQLYGYSHDVKKSYPGATINYCTMHWISGPCAFFFTPGAEEINISFGKHGKISFQAKDPYSESRWMQENDEDGDLNDYYIPDPLKINTVAAVMKPDGSGSALVAIGYIGNSDIGTTLTLLEIAKNGHITTLVDWDHEGSDDIHSIAFSPDGKFILTGAHDNTAKLWSINNL